MLFLNLILVLPLHNSTSCSAHHLILPCCGFWARLQGKKGCEPTSDGLWFGWELRKGQKVTVKASTSLCLSNTNLEAFFIFLWLLGSTRLWQMKEGCLCNSGQFPAYLAYIGWLCSEEIAEHFHVQCKSEKTEALNVSVQLDFEPNTTV